MNKKDFIDVVTTKTGLTKVDVQKVVDASIDTILSYAPHEKVRIDPLGTFNVKTRAARKGRNPFTNESLNIPEKKVLTFKSNAKFKN